MKNNFDKEKKKINTEIANKEQALTVSLEQMKEQNEKQENTLDEEQEEEQHNMREAEKALVTE